MRKRLIALVFITSLYCVPAFAGHSVAGGWCDCGGGTVPGCICDPGEAQDGQSIGTVPDKPKRKQPADLGSETLLILGALLLMLRYKA